MSSIFLGPGRGRGRGLPPIVPSNQRPKKEDEVIEPDINVPPVFDYTDDDPARWNNMFGSLFGMSKAPEEKKIRLTENWYKIIRRWYPDLHKKVYSAPPLHFRAVSYKPKPEKPYHPPEPYLRFGMRMYLTTQYSTTKDDEAQQRVLWTFSTFCRRKSGTAFLLSNMEFQNYLNKNYDPPDPKTGDYPKPNIITNAQQTEEGEVDVLIIDKTYGIFVLEVKSAGDPEDIRDIRDDEKIGARNLQELCGKFKKIGKQMKKQREVVRRLLSDLNTENKIKIKGGFVFANISRTIFENALQQNPDLQKELDIHDYRHVSDMTFCMEDLPERHKPGEHTMDDAVFHKLERIWDNLEALFGKSEPMDDQLYEQIVARFCGPLTTVQIYTEKTYPRVKVDTIQKVCASAKPGKRNVKVHTKTKVQPEESITMAGAARILARKFSELVLLEDQIEVLQRNEEFVHLEGPPGTGKTLVLLLRILTWLDDGHVVWLLSLSPPSRSVTHVLLEQVKRMINQYHSPVRAEELRKRLRLFMLIRHESTLDPEYFKRRLLKFRLRAKTKNIHPYVGYPRPPTLPPVAAPHDRKVCLVLDECGMAGKGLHDFFNWVSILHRKGEFRNAEFGKGLSVWSASLERVGRPCYAVRPGESNEEKFGVLWELKLPLRCPPTVQRALMLVQPSLNQRNVCCFKKEIMLSHPAYPDDAKRGPMGPQHQYAADGLPVYLIAHGSHKKPDEDIWFCFECGDNLANYLQNVLRIGQEQCNCEDTDIDFEADPEHVSNCSQCGKLSKGSFPTCDLPLKYNDVMIIATQNAFQFSVPIGGFAHALAKRKLKISINTTREEGDAPIPPDDVILIADLTSIHGLERAVIIIVPEVKPPPSLPAQYRGTLFHPVDEELPPHVLESIERERSAGRADIVIDGDGEKVEEEDDEGAKPGAIDPTYVNHDLQIKAAMAKGQDLIVTGDGQMVEESEDDVDMKDADDIKTTATGSAGEGSRLDAEMKEVGKGAPATECKIPVEQKDPYTYADTYSESQIKAALESLSPQSRRDVFYIGSRAVCQMILIHRAKDPNKPEHMITE